MTETRGVLSLSALPLLVPCDVQYFPTAAQTMHKMFDGTDLVQCFFHSDSLTSLGTPWRWRLLNVNDAALSQPSTVLECFVVGISESFLCVPCHLGEWRYSACYPRLEVRITSLCLGHKLSRSTSPPQRFSCAGSLWGSPLRGTKPWAWLRVGHPFRASSMCRQHARRRADLQQRTTSFATSFCDGSPGLRHTQRP